MSSGSANSQAPTDQNSGRRLRFYGRRKGRSLSPQRRALMEAVLDKYGLEFSPGAEGVFDPQQQFDQAYDAYWLEIGFGAGEHLVAQASANPEVGLIGCEVFETGVASACAAIDEAGVNNIRVLADDARPFLPALKTGSLDRIFLLHPDPWPKKRHEGRRFVSQAHLDQFARLLKPGSELRIATDDYNYARWTMFQMYGRRDFTWLAAKASDWRTRPDDWPETRYQKKAEGKGVAPVYLRFVRAPE